MRPFRRAGFNQGTQGEMVAEAWKTLTALFVLALAKLVRPVPCIFAVCVAPLVRVEAIWWRGTRRVVEIERHTRLPQLARQTERVREAAPVGATPRFSTDSAEPMSGRIGSYFVRGAFISSCASLRFRPPLRGNASADGQDGEPWPHTARP